MKNKKSILSSIIIFLFILLNIIPIWSEQPMDIDNSLESLLKKRDVIVEIYLIPIDFYTVVPVSERAIRSSYSWKIIITEKVLKDVKDLLFAAQKQMYEQSEPSDIRVLIDILVNNEIVYTIPLSHGVRDELLEAFHNLLRIPLNPEKLRDK